MQNLMYNDVNSVIGGVGLLVANDEIKVPGLTIGIGAKAVAATIKADTKPGRIRLQSHWVRKFGTNCRQSAASPLRASSITARRSSPSAMPNNYQQYGARAEFSVSPQVQVYAGYRKTGSL